MTVEERQTIEATPLEIYIAPMGAAALKHCGMLAAELRQLGVTVEVGTDNKLKRMLELANKLRARYTVIVGDNEIASQSYALKDMASGEQTMVTRQQLIERIAKN